MSTWKFCPTVLLLLLGVAVPFEILIRRTETPTTLEGVGRVGIFPGEARWLPYSLRNQAEGQEIRLPSPHETDSMALQVDGLCDELQRGLVDDPEETVRRYRILTGRFPDVRSMLAVALYSSADTHLKIARSPRGRPEAVGEARALLAVGVAELRHFRDREPENALWPILLLHRELEDAVGGTPRRSYRSFREFLGQFSIRDREALGRARMLAQDRRRWQRVDARQETWRRLSADLLVEHGVPADQARVIATRRSQSRWVWRMADAAFCCLYLAYEGMERGEMAEARQWLDTADAIRHLMLKPDSTVEEADAAARTSASMYSALSVWHARQGNFDDAQQYSRRRGRLRGLWRDIRRDEWAWAPLGKNDQRFEALHANMSVTQTASMAAAACAALWIAAAVWLIIERVMRRRQSQSSTDVRWRVWDTARTVVLAVMPVLILTVTLTLFRPGFSYQWA